MLTRLLLLLSFAVTAVAQTPALGRKVEYKKVDGRTLSLYLVDPPAGRSSHAAIVFFHGGAWTMGEVSQFNQQSAYLASRGMLAVQVEYRLLSREGTDPPRVCAEDAKSAMRWVRAHSAELGVDPHRIVAGGGSAGGFLAAFATMVPGWDAPTDDLAVSPRADALVLFNPVLDGGPNGFGFKRFGDSYRAYSPFYHVDQTMPPTLIQSGDADKLVSPDSLRQFQAAAKAAGVRCELVFYPGQPHSFFTPEPYTTQSLNVAATFLSSLGLLNAAAPTVPTPPAPTIAGAAIVSIDTLHPLTLPPRTHFAGANFQLFLTGSSYRDPKLQQQVALLSPGWLRFPGGTIDDVYDWRTGSIRPEWLEKFTGTKGVAHAEMTRDSKILAGKGPITLADYTTFLRSQPQHPATIGVVNTFTDNAESAGALALAAQKAGAHVDLWELGNEPFFFPSFYADATAYLRAVEPYAAAIRRAVPGARVAVYLQRNDAWIDALAAYPNRFWDELYWHPYPTPPKDSADKLAFYNNFLLNFSNRYLDDTLAQKFGRTYQIEISEYNIAALRGGAYAGAFVAEYAMRLSADPHVTHAGMHILTGTAETLDAAILPSNDHILDALAASHPLDLSTADFGYYLSPYGLALQLVDPVINGSTALWPTTLTGGSTVQATDDTHSIHPMPALYAQAYAQPDGYRAVLFTNKSSAPQPVHLVIDGHPISASIEVQSFGAPTPDARNTPTDPQHLRIQTITVQGDLSVPPYGVLAARWKQP